MKEYNEQVVETLDDAGCIIANKNIIIDNLQARIAELEEEKKELQALLDFDNARLDQIEDELEDVEYLGPFVEGIKVLKTQLAAAQEEGATVTSERDNLWFKLETAKAELADLRDQLAKTEQRVAELIGELEHTREQKNHLWFEFSIATQKLAAEQLNNKLLRDALEAVIKVHGYESGIPVEAISTQTSTEALDKYVAEKVKELSDEQYVYIGEGE